jgi:hypothetical protein
MLVVTPDQEDELRAFCSLVSRRAPHANELAWALARFEMGCERSDPYEALTDYLLALRALLEPEGSASGLLSRRLAALCALAENRDELIERTGQALALERSVIAGSSVKRAGAHAIAGDMADHLRALLRDVICGHLDANLVGLADELLSASAQAAADASIAASVSAEVEGLAEASATAEVSAEQLLGDPAQAEEILDVFI